jgi:DNA-binding LytR/AlgR family response regulator
LRGGEFFTVSKSLKQLEPEFMQYEQFIRVNKSIIINIHDIQMIDKGQNGYIEMHTNNFDFFISRRRKRQVLNAIEVWKSRF